jgi:hypothetical protein
MKKGSAMETTKNLADRGRWRAQYLCCAFLVSQTRPYRLFILKGGLR